MTFRDLAAGDRFEFVPGHRDVLRAVYTKLDDRTFRNEVDGSLGRVGVGDNPVRLVQP